MSESLRKLAASVARGDTDPRLLHRTVTTFPPGPEQVARLVGYWRLFADDASWPHPWCAFTTQKRYVIFPRMLPANKFTAIPEERAAIHLYPVPQEKAYAIAVLVERYGNIQVTGSSED